MCESAFHPVVHSSIKYAFPPFILAGSCKATAGHDQPYDDSVGWNGKGKGRNRYKSNAAPILHGNRCRICTIERLQHDGGEQVYRGPIIFSLSSSRCFQACSILVYNIPFLSLRASWFPQSTPSRQQASSLDATGMCLVQGTSTPSSTLIGRLLLRPPYQAWSIA